VARPAEYVQLLASNVMHDLGILAHTKERAPRLRDAQRFATARATELGYSAAIADRAARIAIDDWRATQRAKVLGWERDIVDAYIRGRTSIDTIGVRVVIQLAYRGKPPPGARETSTVLVNAQPGDSVGDIITRACEAWNRKQITVPHKFVSKARCVGVGRIAQVVSGGWSHAQI